MQCVTLVVELGPDAEVVQQVVGMLEVGGVADRGGEPGRRAHRCKWVEVDGERAERRQLDGPPAAADPRLAVLAPEAA